MFRDTATGARAYAPSSGRPSEYMNRGQSVGEEFDHGDDDDVDFMGGDDGFIGLDEHRTQNAGSHVDDLRIQPKKRKLGNTKKGAVYGAEILANVIKQMGESFVMASAVRASAAVTSPSPHSVAICMQLVEEILEVGDCDELYMLATRVFRDPLNREMFVALGKPHRRLAWLRQEYDTKRKMMSPSPQSIAACMQLVEETPEVVNCDELYFLATCVFRDPVNREMFVALGKQHQRLAWLKQEYETEKNLGNVIK